MHQVYNVNNFTSKTQQL